MGRARHRRRDHGPRGGAPHRARRRRLPRRRLLARPARRAHPRPLPAGRRAPLRGRDEGRRHRRRAARPRRHVGPVRLLAGEPGARQHQGAALAATDIPRSDSRPDGDYPEDQSEQILDVVFKVLDKLGGEGPLLSWPLEAVYDVMARTYDERNFTGPLRNMLPVDRRAPLRVAMAEWSFRPQDLQRVLGECEQSSVGTGGRHPDRDRADEGGRQLHVGVELGRAALHREAGFMYLTEVCKEPEEKAAIFSHLRGSGSTSSASASRSRRIGGRSTSSTPSSRAVITTSTGSCRWSRRCS